MILRTWHGRTTLEDGDAYEVFMKERAAPDYGSVDGLVQLFFTRRDEEARGAEGDSPTGKQTRGAEGDSPTGKQGCSHFLLVTVWRDMEAVKAFAGDDPAKAKYYPEDDRYLLEKEDCSLNHQVFFTA
ncbi:MAG TPA: antibiotic biosynthesis monooxygenase [Hellea balneolensis]|uniref:Antibiotic biosynthesis monooxygenase n=1 Tax=Hellea balneolensis TaxID=287478 RepID=A0A7C3C3C9_9PROT|nr:antibiotic biosynthesis monooxygenase [Hellea balneolensis]